MDPTHHSPSATEVGGAEHNTNSSTSLTEFLLFKDMPPELQIEVWKIAVAELKDRIVEVRFCKRASEKAEALKVYELTFSTPWGKRMIYFNYEKDALYFRLMIGLEADDQFTRFIHQFADKDKICHIALSTLAFELSSFWRAPYILQFCNLKSASILKWTSISNLPGHRNPRCDCLVGIPPGGTRFFSEEQLRYHTRFHLLQDPGSRLESENILRSYLKGLKKAGPWGSHHNWLAMPEFKVGGVLHENHRHFFRPTAGFYYRAEGSRAREEKRKIEAANGAAGRTRASRANFAAARDSALAS